MEKLTPGKTYDIYNHANGFENIFEEDDNYRFFIEKYLFYISPIAETYAYCLMPNHFHLVVRIRSKQILEANFSRVQNSGKVVRLNNEEMEKYISKQFSNFFNSYTQAFNKKYKRMGSLFMTNFNRELITDKKHFINTVMYTHRNPVHHGFCKSYHDWSYTSYFDVFEKKSKIVELEKLILMFGGESKFYSLHNEYMNVFLEDLLE